MKNCLLTKLKGTVDNDSLRKVGELRFDTQGNNHSIAFKIKQDESIVVNALTPNGTFLYGGSSYTTYTFNYHVDSRTITQQLNGQSASIDMNIINKYALTFLSGGAHCDITELNYCKNLESVTGNFYGNIDEWEGLPTALVGFTTINNQNGGRLSGNISKFANFASTIESIYLEGAGEDLVGNLNSLASCTKLRTVDLRPQYSIFNGVEGSIESIADAIKGVRDAGSTLKFVSNGKITYNGTTIPASIAKTVTFDGQGGYTVA